LALHRAVVERSFGDLPIENGEILAEPIEFAQMAINRLALVLRQVLTPQPCPPPLIEQIGVRTIRDQMLFERWSGART
jgi:hypothetical protein